MTLPLSNQAAAVVPTPEPSPVSVSPETRNFAPPRRSRISSTSSISTPRPMETPGDLVAIPDTSPASDNGSFPLRRGPLGKHAVKQKSNVPYWPPHQPGTSESVATSTPAKVRRVALDSKVESESSSGNGAATPPRSSGGSYFGPGH